MKVRFANVNDIGQLIKVRFDYFAADNYEVIPEMKSMISSQLV